MTNENLDVPIGKCKTCALGAYDEKGFYCYSTKDCKYLMENIDNHFPDLYVEKVS